MGMSDLCEIYTQVQGPECKCVYLRRITNAYVIANIYIYVNHSCLFYL